MIKEIVYGSGNFGSTGSNVCSTFCQRYFGNFDSGETLTIMPYRVSSVDLVLAVVMFAVLLHIVVGFCKFHKNRENYVPQKCGINGVDYITPFVPDKPIGEQPEALESMRRTFQEVLKARLEGYEFFMEGKNGELIIFPHREEED